MEYVKKIISILQWLKVYHALDPCIGFKQLLGEPVMNGWSTIWFYNENKVDSSC